MPAQAQKCSVGPLTERPPTNGLTATTGAGAPARPRASRAAPGSARSRSPGSTARSRSARPRRAPPARRRSAARARSRQLHALDRRGGALDDHVLLERQPAGRRGAPACDTGSSAIGSTRAATPIASTTAACASVSRRPARSSSVRIRHIARSRSPSRNQAGRPAASARPSRARCRRAARSRARRSRPRASR